MNTYIIEKDTGSLRTSTLMEPQINHEATTYFTEHYNEILRFSYGLPSVDKSKVQDLVQDVFESLARGESAGKGYDMGYSNEGDLIGVADFVYGRLKGFAKNRKYHKVGCDIHASKKNGESCIDFDIAFASVDDDRDYDSMSAVQVAYATATSYDDGIEAITETASLRNDMQLCIDFSEDAKIDFLVFFKNIDKFAESFNRAIFAPLIKAVNFHDELHDALFNVLEAYGKHRAAFDAALATF